VSFANDDDDDDDDENRHTLNKNIDTINDDEVDDDDDDDDDDKKAATQVSQWRRLLAPSDAHARKQRKCVALCVCGLPSCLYVRAESALARRRLRAATQRSCTWM
jgi:hypothetical protein